MSRITLIKGLVTETVNDSTGLEDKIISMKDFYANLDGNIDLPKDYDWTAGCTASPDDVDTTYIACTPEIQTRLGLPFYFIRKENLRLQKQLKDTENVSHDARVRIGRLKYLTLWQRIKLVLGLSNFWELTEHPPK